MTLIVATFGQPENIRKPGDDARIFRYPVTIVDANDMNTPRQASRTKSLRIKTLVTGSHGGWGLSDSDLIKVLFEFAKERLATHLNSSDPSLDKDLDISINGTLKGPCPYDPNTIQEPRGAVGQIDIHRRIGF